MKILIINQHYSDSLGGSEIQCDIIARGLHERGHDVIYCAVGKKRKERYPEISYKVVPLNLKNNEALGTLLKNEAPDVVYWRFNKNYLYKTTRMIKKFKIPIIFAVSNVNDLNKYAFDYGKGVTISQLPRMISSRYNFRAFNKIDALTVLNSRFLGRLPIKKQQVIWNSMSDETITFKWAKPYCLWVANIKRKKQPEVYIKLAELMCEKAPDLDFIMIGAIQDKSYESILRRAERLHNFHYIGFQPVEIVNGALKNAECLIHTCKPEGFGNNFIQAWMQGCPTISLEFDPDGLIVNQNLGFISGSINHMVQDLNNLLHNRNLRDEIGIRAKEFSHKNFNQERMVEEVESLFLEIIRN